MNTFKLFLLPTNITFFTTIPPFLNTVALQYGEKMARYQYNLPTIQAGFVFFSRPS